MTAVSPIASAAHSAGTIKTKLPGLKSAGIFGGLLTAGFCLFDFAEVPKAFSLKVDSDGNKVEGTNWEAGISEIFKSIPKCAQAFIIPTVIVAAAATAGPVLATIAALGAAAAPFGGYALLDKLLPHEEEKIKLICQEKGIKLDEQEELYA